MSFRHLLAAPVQGTFTMPATGRLAVRAPHGASHNAVLATLITPEKTIPVTGPGINPGGRLHIGIVERGTVVTARIGMLIQLEIEPLEWATIAEGVEPLDSPSH